MKVAIIGAGYTGLSAAYRLSKEGHEVTVFEKEKKPGGLAIGFKKKDWKWGFEEHYHHWFSNDEAALSLAAEIKYPFILKRPKTSVYVDGSIYQLDSPKHLLSFPKLSLLDRMRTAFVLALFRFNPFWKPFERMYTHSFLKAALGAQSYALLWEPQLANKFGSYYKKVSLAWFWARIKKRTPKLAYPKGGYQKFAETVEARAKEYGAVFVYNSDIKMIAANGKLVNSRQTLKFDRVIVTVPTFIFTKLAPTLPKSYLTKVQKLDGLGAMNLVLRLKKKFIKDGTYWLSICDREAPVLAVVEHTNFMNKSNYNGEHLVYVGNYLTTDDARYKMTKNQILKRYDPFLKKINKSYRKNLIGYELFKAPFAQSIIYKNYSEMIPPMKTPLKHVYLANMQQVYPWDRGTNYAVELGQRVASVILKEANS